MLQLYRDLGRRFGLYIKAMYLDGIESMASTELN